MSVYLTYGSTTLELPSPDYPEEPGDVLVQRRARTFGGHVTSVTLSAGMVSTPTLHFTDLTEAQYNALASFVNTTVVGATYAFTYTDWEAGAFTVKYMGGLPGKQVGYEQWVVDLVLAVIPA
ncbi:MAG: hypothetical protein A2Z99_08195 [Treponema sp. GWB1_62_6]|nr:MAG: hypothetical protein A2Z99_08195 [Treponema sp. GWB1_62_6]